MSSERPPTIDGGRSTPPNVNTIIRYALMMSSFAMLFMAGLTFTGRMPFAPWIGSLFVAVAVIDLVIGFVVFHK